MASFSVAFAPLKSLPFTTTTITTTTTTVTSTTAAINRSSCYLKTHRNIMNGTVFCCQNNHHARAKSHVVSSVPTTADVVVNSGITTTATTTAAAVDAATITTVQTGLTELEGGIGILDFMQGKNYLITGATGFLGKVLVEKILRTTPKVGKIFVLIKAKDMEAAMDRLKTEIIDSKLFQCMQKIHGKSYTNFMMSKLIPIAGDLSKSNLGMDENLAREIATQVDVIINSAANTAFDERFDVALDTNTSGPARLLRFAKRCKNLVIFMHVSTAYVNGEREGVVPEKPFYMGESIAGEKAGVKTPAIFPVLDIEAEMKLASDTKKCVPENQVAEKMKELGFKRANMYGWQNIYVFTKAMGEMMINSLRGDIPTVIIRPSIVESTYKEPFPGWIEGNRMIDPVILSYGQGHLPGFVGDPKTIVDVVPIDMVTNALLATMVKHGNMGKSELNVYHIASSVVNPLKYHEIFKFVHNHFALSPLTDSKGNKISLSEFKFLGSIDDFACYICNKVRQNELPDAIMSNLSLRNKRKAEHFINMAKLYEPYTIYKGWFENGNSKKLMEEMSMKEKREFGFDVGSINWEQYFTDVHVPGIRRHVMKGRSK